MDLADCPVATDVQWATLVPEMQGWAPEALGAAIGGLVAALIAWQTTRRTIAADRTGRMDDRRLEAFAAWESKLYELPDSIALGLAHEEEVHSATARALSAWTLFVVDHREFAENVRRCVHRVLILANLAAGIADPLPPSDREEASMTFRTPGMEPRELYDGIVENARTWHGTNDPAKRRAAEAWFERVAAPLREDGLFVNTLGAIKEADKLTLPPQGP